jgi:hypothetical protein
MNSITHKRIIIFFALFGFVSAQHQDAGTTAFPFLTMGYEARSVSMAGAAVGMPNDIYGVLSNPASIGYIGYVSGNRMQIMGGYRQVIMDVWGGPLGISFPTSAGFVIAPYMLALSTGDLDVIDESGVATGERAYSSYTALGLSAAKVFGGDVSVGASFKWMYHYLGAGANESYSADGFAFDLGVQRRADRGRLVYGAVLRNWGFVRSGYLNEWNEYELPYGIEFGVSYTPRHIANLRVAVDVNKYNGDYMNVEPGFEYTILSNILFIRGGYAFSSMDFEKALEVFRGERDDAYQKSNTGTFSLGLGIAGTMDNVDIKLDAAVLFNSDIAAPSFILSLLISF